jgi:phosphoribosylformylglycinamidine synthase I
VSGSRPRVAVLRFPGLNCEEETRRAVMAAGADSDIFMWNGPTSELAQYDGYVLPGGFSYQDRVRAGAIAAKDRVVDCLFQQAASGKPVMGICNGAQILIEAGMVPGIELGTVEMGLAHNIMPDRDGYFTHWTHLVVGQTASCATAALEEGTPVPVPVAHAEGRFVTADPDLIDRLFEQGQVVLTYGTAAGSPAEGFPDNPNGSVRNIAGISNPDGNVVAMMPHPERSSWLFQLPASLPGAWGDRRRDAAGSDALMGPGPGAGVLGSLIAFIEGRGRGEA